MAEFYCIKLIRNDGTRGWLINSPNGIEIAIGGVTTGITQFETEQDALKFIRDQKIERKGIKAFVRTNQELIQESIDSGIEGISAVPADKPIYHLENHKGEKLFYDSKMDAYYFKEMGNVGSCAFDNEAQARLFVKECKFEQPMILMVKHLGKDKFEKTPIQAYGRKENPDGTMGELEYIDFEGGDSNSTPFDNTAN